LYLRSDRTLGEQPGGPDAHLLAYVPSIGANASMWWGELTPDQRPADAFSLVYETQSFQQEVEVLGFPRLELRAAADAKLAHWFGRISDVAPDGSTTLVAGGGINGAHRDSVEEPEYLEPGRTYDIVLDLHFTSWVFEPGHRLRLAICNATFPMIWPSPYPMTTSLTLGGDRGSRLVLPIAPSHDRPAPPLPSATPLVRPDGYASEGEVLPDTWTLIRDEAAATTTVEWEGKDSRRLPWGFGATTERLSYHVDDRDPAHTAFRGEAMMDVEVSERRLRWHHVVEVRSDEKVFAYRCRRELHENDELIRERSWEERVPRDHQ
jgi:hypothetical protein